MSSQRTHRWRTSSIVAGVTVMLVLLAGAVSLNAPVASASGAQSVETTSTLPTDNRQLGNSITRPNEGADPTDPGDPGGWLQVSLFYLVCVGIVIIVGLVWWTSRRARQRRDAAGFDPVALARARGTGVRRAPSPETADPVTESSDSPQHSE